MARATRRSSEPGPRRITNVEVSDKNRKVRLILLIAFLVIAVVAFAVGLNAFLTTDPGWTLVESTASNLNCSGDFLFNYCYGQTEISATEEKKALTVLYSQAVEDAYRIFHEDVEELNQAVNQTVTVDPALYKALSQIQQHENRCLYLGPVYTEYDRIFISPTEVEAAAFDPAQNPEQAAYLAELAAFAADPQMIDLRLLENNQVCLFVSDEYLAYAQEQEITEFLDFGWMRNAFICDYLADTVSAAGFRNGYIASYDGFTRNLDARGESFSMNLFSLAGTTIYRPGILQYSGPRTLVFLRSFPLDEKDAYHYYPFSDGHVVTAMADPTDGLSKSAVNSLLCWSADASCAEVLLWQIPLYLTDAWDTSGLQNLRNAGISSIWFEGTTAYCDEPGAAIDMDHDADVVFTLQYVS